MRLRCLAPGCSHPHHSHCVRGSYEAHLRWLATRERAPACRGATTNNPRRDTSDGSHQTPAMIIRVLGCSGAIAAGCRTTSFLLDDSILIDAGTGVGDLALD